MLVINLGAVSNSFARIDLHTPRHEVGGVHHATWKELLAVDWKGVRKKANVDPAYRAVACGATVSPAWFQNRNTFSTSCIWCKAPATSLGITLLGRVHLCPWGRPPNLIREWLGVLDGLLLTDSDVSDVVGHLSRCQNAIWNKARWRAAD